MSTQIPKKFTALLCLKIGLCPNKKAIFRFVIFSSVIVFITLPLIFGTIVMADINISCACKSFRAVIFNSGKNRGDRATCYCRDCQAAAHYLGSPAVLDAWDGTDLFVTSSARMAFLLGHDQVESFCFSPNATKRWYAKCCRSHICNTFSDSSIPFMSLNIALVSPAERNTLGPSLDQLRSC